MCQMLLRIRDEVLSEGNPRFKIYDQMPIGRLSQHHTVCSSSGVSDLPPSIWDVEHFTCAADAFDTASFSSSVRMEGEQVLGYAQRTRYFAAILGNKDAGGCCNTGREHKPVFGSLDDSIPCIGCIWVFMESRSTTLRANDC